MLVLDEPTNNLDIEAQDMIWEMINHVQGGQEMPDPGSISKSSN
jgi:ABC-type multidrug transport system ATPase subunit